MTPAPALSGTLLRSLACAALGQATVLAHRTPDEAGRLEALARACFSVADLVDVLLDEAPVRTALPWPRLAGLLTQMPPARRRVLYTIAAQPLRAATPRRTPAIRRSDPALQSPAAAVRALVATLTASGARGVPSLLLATRVLGPLAAELDLLADHDPRLLHAWVGGLYPGSGLPGSR